mmetsp:Transcript_26996/g.74217  ORF Transcript_26996/g.74217 Transcript_26996/m.74217 type:complete len:229 (+) Transcript_26996:361-1047(+)
MSVAFHLRRSMVKSRHTILDARRLATSNAGILIRDRAHSVCGKGSDDTPLGTSTMVASTILWQKCYGFHSSATALLSVRRRRRGAARKVEAPSDESLEDSDETTTLQRIHAPVTDPLEFGQAASRLLEKIERAVEPMKASNETFVTKRSDGEIGEMFSIDLGPKVGVYQMEVSLDEQVFEYTSPISGKLLYCLSSTTGEWINMEDGHQFEGILVRDLLRSNCIGLPDL